jgi:spermidine synthase
MSAADGDTERMLATRTLAEVDSAGPLTVCVGGLGLGLTLRQTLCDRRVDEVVVAEIEEAIVRWNTVHLSRFNDHALSDRRVTVHTIDVMELVKRHKRRFDAVILDVDNGPSFLVLERNDAIYSRSGLNSIRRTLKPGGVLGLWSHRPEGRLHRRLDDIFDSTHVTLIEDNLHDRDLPPTAIYTAKTSPRSRRIRFKRS